ncbi:MAG: TIM barrel protein [Kiritimatiellaeota bacterium]|nr:TIM barrel protein [Kiritimatiellota bacterium]
MNKTNHDSRTTGMDRRGFLGAGAAGLIAAAASARAQAPAADVPSATSGKKFKLKYAPMFGAFEAHAGKDPIAQLDFMAEAGFTALLDGGFLGKPVELQDKIIQEMNKLGMTLGGPYCSFTAGGQSMVAGTDHKEDYAKHYAEVCEKLKRVGGKWFLVVPGGLVKGMPMEQMTANVIENLKAIMKVVEPTGCIMTLEPLNPRNHPGLFLTKIPQAVEICKAVGSPSCKIVNDIYHQQITEGDIMPNITAGWDYIAHYHLGDTPGRKEPTTGEINYRSIFKYIYEQKFDGVLGMEHGKSLKGKEGELALIHAYRWCDAFDTPYKI